MVLSCDLIDALMSIPMILSALVIGTLLGGGLKNVIIALGIGMIAVHARIMCAQALTIMQNDYILAAKSLGASNLRIMLRHVLPNSFPPLLVLVTIEMGICILAEAGLILSGSRNRAAWCRLGKHGERRVCAPDEPPHPLFRAGALPSCSSYLPLTWSVTA